MIMHEGGLDIKQVDEQARKKHILLLALSTLHPEHEKSEFSLDGTDSVIKDCIGQLEPIVKLRLKENPNHIPVKIIAMCTKDVREKKYSFNISDLEVNEKTSLEFFADRVKEFAEETQTEIEIYDEDLDEDNPNKGIQRAVEKIRGIKEDISEFWVDTHGGFREVSLIMEAVISLLKVDNIIPQKIYGIRYGSNNSIVDQKGSFDVFDFVSGMNEFIDYGSVSILNRYYKGEKRTDIEELLNAMNKVSEGTKECDTTKYEEGLDDLSRELDRLNDNDSLLSIFRDYVKGSYGILLDSEKRTTMDIVERCLKKGLLQQALTFIEARMPTDFINSGFVHVPSGYLEKYGVSQEQRKKDKHGEAYKSDNNYIVDTFFQNTIIKAGGLKEKEFIENYFKENETVCTFIPKNGNRRYTKVQDKQGKGFIVYTNVRKSKFKEAALLKYMHWALKLTRNKYNHCNPDRANNKEIEKFAEAYIALARSFLMNRENFEDLRGEEINEAEGNYNIKNKRENEKEKVEKDKYTFLPKEITKTKKGLRGVLVEKKVSATLSKINMGESNISVEEMNKAISEERKYIVNIIGKSPIEGEVMVKVVKSI